MTLSPYPTSPGSLRADPTPDPLAQVASPSMSSKPSSSLASAVASSSSSPKKASHSSMGQLSAKNWSPPPSTRPTTSSSCPWSCPPFSLRS
ncbi:phenylalanine ammonia-lyase 2 [Phtheirospermum japonicum]|uniref:Phenylalanine ammonia-lyase 2 n=1 Tax=Phtheirospermum japonicum TaxID=374723 RepID=A0A830BTD8_9LAMI|nr:phenylalanine ammonia-lyase 2 [Phtheirospermum japonicum]